ncbi:hypothetical protein BBJ28_00015961 [Nothophytophthora sp. Chile5]|nr:hypothetical protein BBJ28_00015961 [Nothophytophthora sp. Chile5]
MGEAKHKSLFRPSAVSACLAVFGRIVVAPLVVLVVFTKTKYLSSGKMFIGSDDSYFAYSQMDSVMVGGCTNCQIGCRNAMFQMSLFGQEALMSKPTFEDLFTMGSWNYTALNPTALALGLAMESDGTICMSNIDEWGSPITTFKGKPQMVVDVVNALQLSVPPQVFQEVSKAVETVVDCPTDWVLEAHLRLFRFPTAANSIDFSSIPAADFTIFPEWTECRPDISNDNIVATKLALATHGTDLVAVVPEVLKLFPYSFTSSLPEVSRVIPASGTIYNAKSILQPLFHAYYSGCRVRAVNTTGVYIEASCTTNKHWENYGLMLQSPDDLPVCSTGDVCVHNYYNSLWEFVSGVDTTAKERLWMGVNVFRNRYVDDVALNILPGMVVVQILLMGVISLYQVMSHKRSVLLAQIWAYRCQNGRMQVMYLAQVTYHLVYCSDLYYLGFTTGTLSTESMANLTFSFFAFSYSFINLLKARSGEQQLDRHFRLTWEVMQIFITVAVVVILVQYQVTSLSFIMAKNGELLRKTTARGAAMCNLSDSCIVFTVNLGFVVALASLALGVVPLVLSMVFQYDDKRKRVIRRASLAAVSAKYQVQDGNATTGSKVVAAGSGGKQLLDGSESPLTSFEQHCLGASFTQLFQDCDDIAYVTHSDKRCTSMEAVLLTGFLYYGTHIYQAPSVVLLLMARVIPRRLLRTFNVLLIRWHLDPKTGVLSHLLSCTWYAASSENYKLAAARPIA